MKKGKKFGVIIVSVMLLIGVFSVGAGAAADNRSEAPLSSLPLSEPIAVKDKAALLTELQSREELLFRVQTTENLDGPALQAVVREQEELLTAYGAYYEEFGWEDYQGFVYHDLDALKASIEESILVLTDFIAMVEADVKPPTPGYTKAETILVFEERIAVNEELLQRLEVQRASSEPSEDVLKALSGEYELIYYLPDNIQRIDEALSLEAAS